ncbi:brachyurin-like [Neocloeon triangulifer]|uniref:brachyurin-like n=1 Tax=Neocloeon triangulifer TaxID=2078957 RepID=UPI00286EC9A4|nr:brachyurin-like [Neocloeon triangulifer]
MTPRLATAILIAILLQFVLASNRKNIHTEKPSLNENQNAKLEPLLVEMATKNESALPKLETSENANARKMTGYIVNGVETTAAQFPYQVALSVDDKMFCGGSLIAADRVLTAGHCCQGYSSWMAYMGTTKRPPQNDPGSISVKGKKCLVHGSYNRTNYVNDVAVLFLDQPLDEAVLKSGKVKIIELASSTFNVTNLMCNVSGWGLDNDYDKGGDLLARLNYVTLRLVQTSVCEEFYSLLLNTYKIICACGEGNRSTCQGDSGGPLVCLNPVSGRVVQVGVVSFGGSTCTASYPLGFTAVQNYLEWIENPQVHAQQSEPKRQSKNTKNRRNKFNHS